MKSGMLFLLREKKTDKILGKDYAIKISFYPTTSRHSQLGNKQDWRFQKFKSEVSGGCQEDWSITCNKSLCTLTFFPLLFSVHLPTLFLIWWLDLCPSERKQWDWRSGCFEEQSSASQHSSQESLSECHREKLYHLHWPQHYQPQPLWRIWKTRLVARQCVDLRTVLCGASETIMKVTLITLLDINMALPMKHWFLKISFVIMRNWRLCVSHCWVLGQGRIAESWMI